MSIGLNQALMTGFVFWLLQFLDTYIGTQALTRPIVLASVMGLFAGQPATGVILGAQLEALFMGASAIGGVKPSDYKSGSIVAAAIVCYTGINIEEGLVIAAALGTVLNALTPISKAINNLMQPVYNKIAAEGNHKKFYFVMFLQTVFILNTIACVAITICTYVGVNVAETAITVIPSWLTNGLNVSANVLVVVGLGLMTQSIWGPTTAAFVLVGFILSKYVGLSALSVAVLGIVIAYVQLRNKLQTQNTAVKVSTEEEDDFYA